MRKPCLSNSSRITEIILASKSPRRKMLLEDVGVPFRVITQDTEESYPEGLQPFEIAEFIAKKKGMALKQSFPILQSHECILAADTIVALGTTILGKPKDREDAFKTLQSLSGKIHEVITGVCLISPQEVRLFHASTKVYFLEITDEQINFYIDNFKPYDKAGSYAIQEWIGMVAVEKIEGCYLNVMGLPVSRVLLEIGQIQ